MAAVIAMLMGMAAASALRSVGLPSSGRLLVQVVTSVVLMMLAWVTVVRLRRRRDRSRPLGPL